MGENDRFCTFHDAVKFTLIGMLYGALAVFIILTALNVFEEKPEDSGKIGQVLETAKKKKNGSVKILIPVRPDGTATWTHICCDCALTHKVKDTIIYTFGLDGRRIMGIETEWTVDLEAMEKNRREKWGPFWKKGAQELQFPWASEYAYPGF